MRCLLRDCPNEALPGDNLCADHHAMYRRGKRNEDRCLWCGCKLMSPWALARGYCLDCKRRTREERVAALAKRRAREERCQRRHAKA